MEEARTRGLEGLWKTGPGLKGWLSSVDHQELGLRYIVTAFAFLVMGGVEALAMRLQLARPERHLISPNAYNVLYSAHGMTMIFLYSFPILSGFSIYLWPSMLGTRDMAFPRVNASSHWMFLASGLFMYAGVALGFGPNDGWSATCQWRTGRTIPAQHGLLLAGDGVLRNFYLRRRRQLRRHLLSVALPPGMSFDKAPILTWGTLTASVAHLLVGPAVSLAFFILWMDRQVGTHFFDVPRGGQALLWRHLFWIFAHPWVYVIVLPAMSMVSDALPVLCPCSARGRSSATPPWRSLLWRPWCWGSASGCTTCSPPACLTWRSLSSPPPPWSSPCRAPWLPHAPAGAARHAAARLHPPRPHGLGPPQLCDLARELPVRGGG